MIIDSADTREWDFKVRPFKHCTGDGVRRISIKMSERSLDHARRYLAHTNTSVPSTSLNRRLSGGLAKAIMPDRALKFSPRLRAYAFW